MKILSSARFIPALLVISIIAGPIFYSLEARAVVAEAGFRDRQKLLELSRQKGNRENYAGAIKFLNETLTFLELSQDSRSQAESLNSLCSPNRRLDNHQKAWEYCESYPSLSRQTGDLGELANSLGKSGNNSMYSRECLKVITDYQQSLKTPQEIGEQNRQALALNYLGRVSTYVGKYQDAKDCYKLALKITQKIDARKLQGTILANLGFVSTYLGEYQEAGDYYKHALEIAWDINA